MDIDTVNNVTSKIINQVCETEDSFIFQTLSDFASTNYQITVKKEELIYAIQLIRMYRETGVNISERCVTATQQSEWYRHAYNRGFEDGIKKEHDRITSLLDNARDKENNQCSKYESADFMFLKEESNND